MRIKEVAERSGFSASTLRYYEEIGLLPAPARTAAGYRTYDQSTVERLAFIARAKQLGCSLEEIGELATAWEGGRCGPVQDRLRTVVAAKLAAARAQVDELLALARDLRGAAAALEQHRPDGACDERCGCVSDPTSSASVPVRDEVPIACTLDREALPGRVEEWRAVLAAGRPLALDDGVRVELPVATPLPELVRLVAAEQHCCRFLRFAITVDARGVGVEVTGPDGARPMIESLVGPTT